MSADLNFHHLRLFRAVVRAGSITAAARSLHLTPQTVSTQVQSLERFLGAPLLDRSGRTVAVTELGRGVAERADEIFDRGRELVDAVQVWAGQGPLRLVVGVTDVMPKLVARHLLAPAFGQDQPLIVECREDRRERLLSSLALHELDVVLSDDPTPPHFGIRTFDHLLGECGVTLMATPRLSASLGPGFPDNLDGAPLLLPRAGSVLRTLLDGWLGARSIRPRVTVEFDDSALAKELAADGLGAIAVPSVIEDEVARRHDLVAVGRFAGMTERFFAISTERRIRHPAVAALARAARSGFFAGAGPAA